MLNCGESNLCYGVYIKLKMLNDAVALLNVGTLNYG